MNRAKSIEIYGCGESIAFCEAQGLSKCFQAYADNCAGEYIMTIGFNPNSGYTYIALENGLQICSILGSDVEYLITDFEDGEENFYESFELAISNLKN